MAVRRNWSRRKSPKGKRKSQSQFVPRKPASAPARPVVAWKAPNPLWQKRIHLALLWGMPWLLFSVNRNWTFQGLGHMDNWYYSGYFIHFLRYQQLAPQYSGERLAWIIPGRILTWLLSPPIGGMMLNFLCYSAALVLLYFIIKRFTDARTGFLTACLVAVHPCYIGANGWNHLNGGSNVYMLLAYLALMRSHGSPHARWYWTLAGAAWAGLLNCYIAWVIFTPVCLFMYVAGSEEPLPVWWSRRRIFSLIQVAAFFTLGFAITFLAMGTLYALFVGTEKIFFYNNIKTAIAISKLTSNPWSRGDFTWIPIASWIVSPAIVTVLTLGVLAFRRRLPAMLSGRVHAILVSFLYSVAIMVIMTIRQTRLLEFDYFAAILQPISFITLAVLAVRVPASVGSWTWRLVAAGALCISGASLCKPLLYRVLLGHGMLYPYLILLAGVAVWLAWPAKRTAWIVLIVCLSLGQFSLVPAFTQIAYVEEYDGLAAHRRVADAVGLIDKRYVTDARNQYPTFWIDNQNDPYTREYRSIMCSFTAHHVSMQLYPEVDKKLLATYKPGDILTLITPKRDVLEEANRRMSAVGMPLELAGQDLISRQGVSYWVTFVRILIAPS